MELIGFFQVIFQIAIWGGLIWGLGWVALKIDHWGKKNMRLKREREIEVAMRLGMADAEAQQRIAQRIIDERG